MDRSLVFGSAPLPDNFPNGHENGEHHRSYYMFEGFGDGGVIAPAFDLARFFHALFVDESLLTGAMMAEILHDPVGEGYGMGIEVDGAIVGHSGGDLGFSSDVRLDRDNGTLAIILSASADTDIDWTIEALDQ
jgi:D-alanyl-D-alanine carboxypeptidase